ncbi:MAG: universal stress protein [Chloroflexi bacterium]|nr:universal stress protein [Chloroflexota bacterium]
MYNRILIPLDSSELAECVLPHVEAIARGCGVKEVIAVTVVEPVYYFADDGGVGTIDVIKLQQVREEGAAGYLNEVAKKLEEKKLNVKTALLKGNPADSIVDYAKSNNVDLIAMATHGRSGISRWVWGSTAEKILRASPVPILLVRPDGGCKV